MTSVLKLREFPTPECVTHVYCGCGSHKVPMSPNLSADRSDWRSSRKVLTSPLINLFWTRAGRYRNVAEAGARSKIGGFLPNKAKCGFVIRRGL